MKRCMYCGHENEDSLVSCSVCGNKLGIAVPTQEPVTAEEVVGQESAGGEAVNAAEPEAAQSVPSSFAALSIVRQDVVPTQMTRPPFSRAALVFAAVSAVIS